jgi:uncharacterized protein (DUF1778 family)
MKIDSETKLLAERAAAVQGLSLSAYLNSLIRQNAPLILAEQHRIKLTNLQYDRFAKACEQPENWPQSVKLLNIVKEIESEGY